MNTLRDAAAEAANAWYWANAYKASVAMFTLVETGVLERLANARLSVSALASDLGLSQRALEPVLSLMVDLAVLDHNPDGFFLPRASATLLPLLSLESLLSSGHIQRDALSNVLRGGSTKDPMEDADAPRFLQRYLAAMAVGARALAPHLVRFAKLGPRPRLIDLGGADGALVLGMARVLPDLEGTVVDRPQVEPWFWDRVAASGEEKRFRFVAGDLRRPSEFVQEFSKVDTVLMSNVLHLLSLEERLMLLKGILDHAEPATRVLIYDQFTSAESMIDAARFMVIDWLLVGYCFDCNEKAFAAALLELGFASVSCQRNPALPGAMVFAQVPEQKSRNLL